MSDELPDDVRALLASEQTRSEPPAEELARIRQTVDDRIAPTNAPSRAGQKISARSLLLGVVIGAAAAHLADRVLRPSRVQVVVRWQRSPADPSLADAAVGVTDARAAAVDAVVGQDAADAAAALAARRSPLTATGATSEFAAERLLVERCSSALVRGDAAGALVAAREHARRFRDGLLVEEREALTIQALRALGRDAEAAARTEVFLRRWPTSMHAPALRGARR